MISRILVLSLLLAASVQAEITLSGKRVEWIMMTTPHFRIVSSASARQTERLARELESLAGTLTTLDPHIQARPAEPIDVFVFGSTRVARPYFHHFLKSTDVDVTGLFVGRGVAGAMLIDSSRDDGTLRTARHELVHALLASAGAHPPLWLNEGLAEYFSAGLREAGSISFGTPIIDHLHALRRGERLSLRELIRVTADSPEYLQFGAQQRFYAESWLLVDTLMSRSRKPLEQVRNYLRLVTDEEVPEKAFEAAFGISVDRIARELTIPPVGHGGRVVQTSTMDAVRFDQRLTSLELSRGAALTELGDLVARFTDDDHSFAREHFLAASATRAPAGPLLARLGALRVREGQYEHAKQLFDRASRAAPDDPIIATIHGEALLRRAAGSIPQVMAVAPEDRSLLLEARTLFSRAMQSVDSARALGGYGATFIADAKSDLTPGIAALERARAIAPGRSDYALHLFALYSRADVEERAALLRRELEVSPDVQVQMAWRAALLRAKMETIDELIALGDFDEAIGKIRELASATPEGEGREQFEQQIRDVERLAQEHRDVALYNHAVELSNRGEIRAAIRALDTLAESSSSERLLTEGRALRARLASRLR